MQPGVYDGIPNAEYHGGPGESKSLLDLVRKSPAHYRQRQLAANDDQPKQSTPAQMIGTAFHALVLEPGEFVKGYTLAPRPQDVPDAVDGRDALVAMVEELNKGRLPKLSTTGTKDELVARVVDELHGGDGEAAEDLKALKAADLKDIITKANESRPGLLPTTGTIPQLAQLLRDNGRAVTLWSEVKEEWARNNAGRQVLTQDQWDQLHRMRDAVMAHPAARSLMTGCPGVAERSVYWVDDETGLLCRCRPDFWRNDGVVVDLKTTEDASPEAFARSIAGWRYHVQHPFYLDGITSMQRQAEESMQAAHPEAFVPVRAFVFLAVEKDACVVDGVAKGVAVYVLDAESVELGRAEYRHDLGQIAACRNLGAWPGYGDRIMPLSLPRWKLAQAAEGAAA